MSHPPKSLWWDSLSQPLKIRESVDSNLELDVAIIGAGYTGLWSAYYLKQNEPNLKIGVIEANVAGFGASGRNGGWCSALFPVGLEKLAKQSDRQTAIRMQKTMFETVDEVGRVIEKENIDAEWQKGGSYSIARDEIQLKRAKEEAAHFKEWGFSDDDFTFFDKTAATIRINAANILGTTFTPHCASINPAKLVRQLSDVVERMGVKIYENSKVTRFLKNKVFVNNYQINAKFIINATEAYRSNFKQYKRASIPVYSLMIATEPLSQDIWNEIGLKNRETFADYRNVIIYGQRTKDNRFAFGGRGAPYHYGSKINPVFDQHARTHHDLLETLIDIFPVIKGVKVTHTWGGPLAIARDWAAHVTIDKNSNILSAGSYVGDGVGTSNLAGRTISDLILNKDTNLTNLPWVQHKSRKWEIEPFRWIGINSTLQMAKIADVVEKKFKKETFVTKLLSKLRGH
ncbi:MAG: NAD(P)/FAD-dependent oxidoreductase [Candidatus Nanopelagicales bacterium]